MTSVLERRYYVISPKLFFYKYFLLIKLRTHYLELLHRLLGSTNYTDHRHRQGEILSCLQRIMGEEGKESQPDQEAVKRLWDTYPDVFGSQDSS